MPDLSDRQFLEQIERLEAELRERIVAATADLPDGSPKACAARRTRARSDRLWACGHYFPHLFGGPFSEHHRALVALHEEPGALLVLESVFRGWGKTTFAGTADIVLDLALGRTRFQVLTGKTDKQTAPMCLRVRLELECNRRLRQDFPALVPGALWQALHFQLGTGQEVLGLSLLGASRGPLSLAGERPDRWDLDDLQERKDVLNPEHIEQVVEYVMGTVVPAMAPGPFRVRVRGTPMSDDCALMRLKAREGVRTFWLPALDAAGAPVEPARFPAEHLARLRTLVGSEVWEREYQLAPVARDALVQRRWFQAYRREQAEALTLICSVMWDPAIKVGGDYRAILTQGLDQGTGRIYVLRAFIRNDASPREQTIEFWRQCLAVLKHPQWILHCGFESNGFQALHEYPLAEVRKQLGAPELPLRLIVHTQNKELRVAGMVPVIERGAVFVDPADSDQARLVDQWVYWPRAGCDGPDAQEAGWRMLQRATARFDAAVVGELMGVARDARISL